MSEPLIIAADRTPEFCTNCKGTGIWPGVDRNGNPWTHPCDSCGGSGLGVNIGQAIENAIEGLLTDGGHRKQWFLERILQGLGVDLDHLRGKLIEDDYDWEDGIAP